jgi:uncharacterized caspase-like protein
VTLIPKYSNSHALVIGINYYKTSPPLGYAVNDAVAVATALSGLFHFPKEKVHLLLDSEATHSAILDHFLSFACDGTEVNDRLVVFFAGHGHTVRSSRGEIGYLVPSDGDCHNLASLIRWDELTRNADLIEAKHILFLMDACYGGLAIMRAIRPGSMRFLKDMMLRRSRQVLTAGKADEMVADRGGPLPNHSVFTGHLLKALEGNAASPEGLLTANGVVSYVYQSVARDPGSKQTPHFGYLEGDGDLIFSTDLLADCGPKTDDLKDGDPLIPEEDVLVPVPAVLVPGDTEVAMTTIGQAKEFLSEERSKIKLHDLVSQEVREVLSTTAEDYFAVQGTWSTTEFLERMQKYETATAELLQIQALLGFWSEPYNRSVLTIAPKRLGGRIKMVSGLTAWLSLRYYPMVLLLYSGGIAAIAAERYDNLRELMLAPVSDPQQTRLQNISLIRVVADEMNNLHDAFKSLPGHERQYTPRSEYLLKLLQPLLDDLLLLGSEYEATFDRFEALYALEHAHHYASEEFGRVWGPVGRFAWKRSRGPSNPLHQLIMEAEKQGASWPPVKAGLFGGSIDRFKELVAQYDTSLATLSWF